MCVRAKPKSSPFSVTDFFTGHLFIRPQISADVLGALFQEHNLYCAFTCCVIFLYYNFTERGEKSWIFCVINRPSATLSHKNYYKARIAATATPTSSAATDLMLCGRAEKISPEKAALEIINRPRININYVGCRCDGYSCLY